MVDWGRAKGLFIEAMGMEADRRQGFVAERCAGDPSLKAEVLSLLERLTASGGFLEDASAIRRALEPAPGSSPGRIGGYTVLAELGRGAMGVVYLAQQKQPRRAVALKLIRSDQAAPSFAARFRREAEAQGRLQHPGIAQIFEAGTFDGPDGPQPFLAMELVAGLMITRHADRAELDVPQRLELVARVCDAVDHAHRHGVIHRDLKPGNILMAQGAEAGDPIGQPKILDFGVARLAEGDGAWRTRAGQPIGTIPYMSPEQIRGQTDAIDHRSDIYALGVLGYRLLAGRLPFDPRDLSLPEVARVICEVDPTPLESIDPSLIGGPTEVVARAMSRDVGGRFDAAGELGVALRQAARGDSPIAGGVPQSIGRRRVPRRGWIAGGAVVGIGLVTVVVAGILLERNRTLARANDHRDGSDSQWMAPGGAASDALERDLVDQILEADQTWGTDHAPTIAARTRLGDFYLDRHRFHDAEAILAEAMSAGNRVFGPDDPQTGRTRIRYGLALAGLERFDEAEAHLRRGVRILVESGHAGDEWIHPAEQRLQTIVQRRYPGGPPP